MRDFRELTTEVIGPFIMMILAMCGIVLLTMASFAGCAATAQHTSHAVAPPMGNTVAWNKPGVRCTRVGIKRTINMSVIVERGCFTRGLTTVGIVVHNTRNKGRLATKDAATALIGILGYRPALSTLFIGKLKGQVFLLAAVVPSESIAPIARR